MKHLGWILAVGIAPLLAMSDISHAQTKSRAVAVSPDGTSTLSARAISISSEGEGGDKHAIEIRVDGDDVKVIRDGKEVPAAHVVHDADGIIIVDKDGKEIQKLNVKMKFGGDGNQLLLKAMQFGEESEPAEAPKVMLGVHMTEPGAALEHHLHLEPGTTTMISGLYEGLPADAAGIGEFDIITQVEGKTPADNKAIRKALEEKNPGDTIAFTVIHEGKTKQVSVKLAAYDREAMAAAKLQGGEADNQIWQRFGGNIAMPQFKDMPVIVAPGFEWKGQLEAAKPYLNHIYESSKQALANGGQELDERLKQLDERLAQLEELLQKFADRHDKKP